MTDSADGKPNLGRFGSFGRGVTPQQAKEIESLGYGAVWVGGSPPAELAWVEPILAATNTLQVATGIVNIWTADAKPVAESFHRIDKAYPGRFLLGIGVGHPEAISEYRKPYDALADYLDRLDDYGVPAERRVVAALGPRVLQLSAQRSAGAHPYLTTPEHTAQARELIGRSAFLAPEHKVVLTTDADKARYIDGQRTLWAGVTSLVLNLGAFFGISAFSYRKVFNPSCSCRAPGQSWADALRQGDDQTLERGDIVVTEERARQLSQPRFDAQGKPVGLDPNPMRQVPAAKNANSNARGAPLAPAGAAAPASAPAAETADEDPGKRKVRSVGPAFYPVR